MKLLLDTNVFIPLEPASPNDVKPTRVEAVQLARLIVEGGHQAYIHPVSENAQRLPAQLEPGLDRRLAVDVPF